MVTLFEGKWKQSRPNKKSNLAGPEKIGLFFLSALDENKIIKKCMTNDGLWCAVAELSEFLPSYACGTPYGLGSRSLSALCKLLRRIHVQKGVKSTWCADAVSVYHRCG